MEVSNSAVSDEFKGRFNRHKTTLNPFYFLQIFRIQLLVTNGKSVVSRCRFDSRRQPIRLNSCLVSVAVTLLHNSTAISRK